MDLWSFDECRLADSGTSSRVRARAGELRRGLMLAAVGFEQCQRLGGGLKALRCAAVPALRNVANPTQEPDIVSAAAHDAWGP